jgi:vitamin B12 transporter
VGECGPAGAIASARPGRAARPFSAFADAATVRAAALFRPVEPLTFHLSYGEGIAQPSFYDLFGFFPGSSSETRIFAPKARGLGSGLQMGACNGQSGATFFTNKLREEILTVFDPATFIASTVNAQGTSPARGWKSTAPIAGAASGWMPYILSRCEERKATGDLAIREARRPRTRQPGRY